MWTFLSISHRFSIVLHFPSAFSLSSFLSVGSVYPPLALTSSSSLVHDSAASLLTSPSHCNSVPQGYLANNWLTLSIDFLSFFAKRISSSVVPNPWRYPVPTEETAFFARKWVWERQQSTYDGVLLQSTLALASSDHRHISAPHIHGGLWKWTCSPSMWVILIEYPILPVCFHLGPRFALWQAIGGISYRTCGYKGGLKLNWDSHKDLSLASNKEAMAPLPASWMC